MTNSEKLLCLGGSAQQSVAIKAAKKLGYYTVLIDYLPDNPGQYIADKFYQESTTNIEAVYKIAKKEQVHGILAYASDPAALPAAIVSERLGLSTNPSTSVEILGEKHKFREFLKTHNFASPKCFTFHPSITLDSLKKQIEEFKFPLVIKPTDSSGSKGVSFLQTSDGFASAIQHADTYSRNKILIVEEFIERGYPFLIGGDIFVLNGKIVLYGEMACLRSNGGKGLIPIGKRPHALNEMQVQCIHTELQRLISKLEIRSGELNIELLLDKENNVHFLEVGPRAGGNMIPLQLSDAFGVDLINANVQVAMGKSPDLIIHKQQGYFVTYVLHSYHPGIFDHIEFSSEIEPFIYRKEIYKHTGDVVEFFDGAGKAVGIIFLRIDTETHVNDLCNRLEELIKVIVR